MTMQELVENPFQAPSNGVPSNAVAQSDAERAMQEVHAALAIAKRFPRDTVAATDKILNACTRPTLANTALYSYPRGGQEVTGPSIRLAEAMAQQWGNLQFGIRELSSNNGVSSVEAFAWDIESNTRQTKTFQVTHERHTRQGKKALTDPRDIYELIANQGARRMRSCILAVIPGDVTEAALNQCAVTQKSNVDVSPDAIKAMANAFEENYGISQDLIEKRIGKRIEAINAPQLLSLRRVYQSLKDGMSKPSDWFDVAATDQQNISKASSISIKKTEASSATDTADLPKDHTPEEPTPSAEGIFESSPA